MGMRLNSHLLQFLYLLRNFRFRKIKLLHILSLLLEDEMTSMGFASIIPASTKSYMLMARCLFIITSYSFEQQLKAKNISIRKYQFFFFYFFEYNFHQLLLIAILFCFHLCIVVIMIQTQLVSLKKWVTTTTVRQRRFPSKQHIKDTLSEARPTRTIAQREQLSFNAPTKVIYMYSYFGVPGLFSHVHRHDFLIFYFNEVNLMNGQFIKK